MEENQQTSVVRETVETPHDWEKVVSVAYLRATGDTQKEAAAKAGCSERTVRVWEHSPFWPKAQFEANRRWLQGVEAFARRGIMSALVDNGEYAQMARWVAERTIPEMIPPKQRRELSGPDGGPIPTENPLDLSLLTDEELADLKRITAKASGNVEGD